MALGLLDVGWGYSCLWLGDGRDDEELWASHPNGWMASWHAVIHCGFHFCE